MSAVPEPADFPGADAEIPAFLAALGIPGIIDLHVHALPPRLQAAVWAFFDGLDDPPWPIRYRLDQQRQLDGLAAAGVIRHAGLAYAHQPGMLDWLNGYTLDLADTHPAVIPTFTIYPEPGVAEQTHAALARGAQVVKVHVQVGRFALTDPLLDDAWRQIVAHRAVVVLHASAVYGVAGGHEHCGADAVRALLDRHPGLQLVIAHLGMPTVGEFLDLADEVSDLRYDVAMTLNEGELAMPLTPADIARIAEHADRLVFGSDFPSIPHDYATQVRALARLRLDEAELREILHDRPQRLLAAVR